MWHDLLIVALTAWGTWSWCKWWQVRREFQNLTAEIGER